MIIYCTQFHKGFESVLVSPLKCILLTPPRPSEISEKNWSTKAKPC